MKLGVVSLEEEVEALIEMVLILESLVSTFYTSHRLYFDFTAIKNVAPS